MYASWLLHAIQFTTSKQSQQIASFRLAVNRVMGSFQSEPVYLRLFNSWASHRQNPSDSLTWSFTVCVVLILLIPPYPSRIKALPSNWLKTLEYSRVYKEATALLPTTSTAGWARKSEKINAACGDWLAGANGFSLTTLLEGLRFLSFPLIIIVLLACCISAKPLWALECNPSAPIVTDGCKNKTIAVWFLKTRQRC